MGENYKTRLENIDKELSNLIEPDGDKEYPLPALRSLYDAQRELARIYLEIPPEEARKYMDKMILTEHIIANRANIRHWEYMEKIPWGREEDRKILEKEKL